MNYSDKDLNSLFSNDWKNYKQDQPIEGGMAYESQLRQCTLDGTLNSLKELDTLLMTVRKDIQVKLAQSGKKLSNKEQQLFLAQQDKFCRFVLFIGCYTGMILSKIYQHQTRFINHEQLKSLDNRFNNRDLAYSMAVSYVDNHKPELLTTTKVADIHKPWLFFVFEPIVMRLFGSFDYQIKSIQGQEQVIDGLYHAVIERIPEDLFETLGIDIHEEDEILEEEDEEIENDEQSEVAEVEEELIQEKPKDIYQQLLSELSSIPFEQSARLEQYQKVKNVMIRFDELAESQGVATADIELTERQSKVLKQTLEQLKQVSGSGNTTAMLHLAAYYMRGDWTELDKKKGVTLIQDAAKSKDPRAMRILSKLHYQGVAECGIRQSVDSGNLWLEEAAKAGHPEAKTVHSELQKAQMMINDRSQEKQSDKRYLYLFAFVGVLGLLLLIFL